MKKPKQPDRFERMVKRAMDKTELGSFIRKDDAINLLRLVHLAHVRMVNDSSVLRLTSEGGAYYAVLRDKLLNKLESYAR